MTRFEQLPNELVLMCFRYLDFYHLCGIFSCLNRRSNQLIQHQANIHIDLDGIPPGKFLTFCFSSQMDQFKLSSQNGVLSMVANDKHKLNILLDDDLLHETFSKLKSLSLSNMSAGTTYSMIFDKAAKIDQNLERLSLLQEISEDDFRSDIIQRKNSNG